MELVKSVKSHRYGLGYAGPRIFLPTLLPPCVAHLMARSGMVWRNRSTAQVLAQARRRPDPVAASRRSLRGGVQPQERRSVGGRDDGAGGHEVGRTRTNPSRSKRFHLRLAKVPKEYCTRRQERPASIAS